MKQLRRALHSAASINRRLSIGPLLLVALLAAIKIAYLAYRTETSIIAITMELGAQELSGLACLTLLALYGAAAQRRTQLFLARSLLSAASLWYAADLLTIILINGRFDPASIIRFGSEAGAVTTFIGPVAITAIVAWILAQGVLIHISRRSGKVLAALSLTLVALPLFSSSSTHLTRAYETPSLRSLVTDLQAEMHSEFTEEEIDYYETLPKPPPVEWREDNPNIILLIVESLSAINSKRWGGTSDNFKGLDRIAEAGITFKNAIANYYDTEGGIVALFNMTPVLPAPGEARSVYDLYAPRESIVRYVKSRGYRTTFLTSGDLEFLNKRKYIHDIGFESVIGRDETERLRTAPQITFKAPADGVLYDELLDRLEDISKDPAHPYFLSALTVSSHLPHIDPLNRGDTEENVLNYVDTQIVRLHDELVRRNFFDNGVLVIVGDHRKMLPVAQSERTIYGDSAPARIILTVKGKGIPAGAIDERLIQQADLFRYFGRLTDQTQTLSEDIVVPERYSFPWMRSGTSLVHFDLFTIETGAGISHPGILSGNQVVWEQGLTPAVTRAEEKIAKQRASLQQRHVKTVAERIVDICGAPAPLPPEAHLGTGFLMRTFWGSDVKVLSPARMIGTLAFFDRVSQNRLDETHFTPSSDYFVVSVHGTIRTEASGLHLIKLTADDNACMWIDGQPLLAEKGPSDLRVLDSYVHLEEGLHQVEIRYGHHAGISRLRLQWSTPEFPGWREVLTFEPPLSP